MRVCKGFLGLAAAAALVLGAGTGDARADGEVHLYNWANYFPPDLMEKFEKETGIKVTLDTYASDEDMMAKLQAGGSGYDIVFPGGQIVQALIAQGLAEKIDAKSMSNFANVAPPFQSVAGDENREYTVPYMWGTTGFTYDSAKVPGGKLEESWKEFFEPRPELVGKIGALDSEARPLQRRRLLPGHRQVHRGRRRGAEDPGPAEGAEEGGQGVRHRRHHRRLVSGEVILFQHWNGAAHRTKKQLPTASTSIPQEGTGFWTDNMMVPKGAPDLDNAKTFLNWMMAAREHRRSPPTSPAT